MTVNQARLIKPLLKICQLVKRTGESNATICHWIKRRLAANCYERAGEYQLNDEKMIKQVQKIRKLYEIKIILANIWEKLEVKQDD